MRHPDEGTIHAWLDGQLPPEEARALEAHVAECGDCAAAVAEARGFIAASSRILSALDDVPGGVIPLERRRDETVSPAARSTREAKSGWRNLRVSRLPIAAAIVFIAAGTVLVTRTIDQSEMMRSAAEAPMEAQEAALSAESDAGPPAGQSAPATEPAAPAPPRVAPSLAAGAARAESERRAADQPEAVNAAAVTDVQLAAPAPPPSPQFQAADKVAAAELRAEEVAGAPAGNVRQGELGHRTGTGAIAGGVTDERGEPIAGAAVILPAMGVRALTDSAGRFVLDDVPAGRHDLAVRRIGYEPGSVGVTVAGADTVRVRVAIPQASLRLSEAVVTSQPGARAAPSRCYSVEPGRWTIVADSARDGANIEAGPLPERIALDVPDEERMRRGEATQRSAAAARAETPTTAARVTWTELGGDSLRVTWASSESGTRLDLSGRRTELRGEAVHVDGTGRVLARASVRAEPVACDD